SRSFVSVTGEPFGLVVGPATIVEYSPSWCGLWGDGSFPGGVTVVLPVVAIVGRPNVGKSSLFNWLAGRRIAIVEPTAGVTRDRVAALVPVGERFVELVDTGGMGHKDADNLTEHVERQIETAIDQAHVLLFVVDGRAGVTPLD